jgi:hypothetical protein
MAALEIGKSYTTKELQQTLEISVNIWKKKKNEYLDSLSQAYEYEITQKGRATLYTFTKQIGEYQKPENKRSREKTNAIIHQFIRETIEEDNLQTAANITRRAFRNRSQKTEVAELGLKESTTCEYTRIQMREMFGSKVGQGGTDGYMMEKVWCKLNKTKNRYEELSQDIVEDYYKIFNKHKLKSKEELHVVADYDSGLITKEEYNTQIGNNVYNTYEEAREEFVEKYCFYPIRVPRYQLCAWQNAAT